MQSTDYEDALQQMLETASLQKYNQIIEQIGKLAQNQEIVERALSEKSSILQVVKNQEPQEVVPFKALVSNLLVELSSEKGYDQKVAIELNTIKSKVEILELEKHLLNGQLHQSKSNQEKLQKQLEESDAERNNMLSDWNIEKNRLNVEMNMLKQSEKATSESMTSLNSKLSDSKTEIEKASDNLVKITAEKNALQEKLNQANESYRQLENSVNGPKHENKEKLYQEQIENLTKINARLTADLQQAEKSSTSEAAPPSVPSAQLQELADTDPQHLIQMYQKVRDKLDTNLQAMKSLTIQNQQLERVSGDKDDALGNIQQSLEELKQDNTELSFIISEKVMAVSTLENENDILNQKITELAKSNADLDASLKDTTKQLQHILSNATDDNKKDSEGVFKNVVELQSLNMSLMSENRSLKEQVAKQTDKLSGLENTVQEKHDYYKNALNKALDAITLSQEENARLNTQIAELEKDGESFKALINTLNETSDVEIDTKWKAQVEQFNTTQEKYEFFIQHTKEEIILLKDELKESRELAFKTSANYVASKAEAEHLRKVNSDMKSRIEKHTQSMKSSYEQYAALTSELNKTQHELHQANDKLAKLQRREEFDDMKDDVNKSQMQTMKKTYEMLLNDLNKTQAEKMDLTVILDNTTKTLKENMAVKGKVIEELGSKLAASDRALELLRTQFKENTEKLERWEAIEPENLQIKCGELTTQVESLKIKLDEADQKVSTESQEKLLALAKLSQAELKLNAGEAYVPEEAVAKHLETIANTEEKNRQLQEVVDSQKKAIEEHVQKLEEMKQEFEKKKSESQLAVDKLLNTLEEKNILVTAQLVSTEETVRVLEESVEIVNLEKKKSLDERQSLQEEITTLNQKNEENVAKLKENQTQIDQYTEDLATQLAELEDQKRINSEFENRFASLHQQYEKLENEFCKDKDEVTNGNYQKLTKVLSEQQSIQWREALGQIEAENTKHYQKTTDILKRIETKLGEQHNDSSEESESITYYKSIAQSACQLNQVLHEEKEGLFESLKARLETIDKLQTELFESQYKVGEVTNRIAFLHERNKLESLEQSKEVRSEKNRADAFKGLYDEQMKQNNVLKVKISASDEDITLKIKEINELKKKVSGLENTLLQTQADVQSLIDTKAQLESRLVEEKEKQSKASSEEMAVLKSELETAKGGLEIAQNDFESTKTTLEITKAELETANTSLETSTNENKELQTKLEESQTQYKALVQKANDRGRMAMEFKRKLTACETKCAELEKQVETLQGESAPKEGGSDEPQGTDAESKLTETQTQLAEYKAKLEELQAKVNEPESKEGEEKSSDAANLELTEVHAKLAESEKKLADLEAKLSETENKVESNGGAADSSENADPETAKQLVEAREKYAEAENKLSEMTTKLTELETKVAKFENADIKMENAADAQNKSAEEKESSGSSEKESLEVEGSLGTKKNLVDMEVKLSEVEALLLASQTTCSVLENEKKELAEKLTHLQANIEEKDANIKRLTDELETATQKVTELESKITEAKSDQPDFEGKEELSKKIESLQEEHTKLLEEHKVCSDKIKGLEKDALDNKQIKQKYSFLLQKFRQLQQEKAEKLKEQTESKQPIDESSSSTNAPEEAQAANPQEQVKKPQEEEQPQTEIEQIAPASKKSPRSEEGDPEDAPPVKKQHVDE